MLLMVGAMGPPRSLLGHYGGIAPGASFRVIGGALTRTITSGHGRHRSIHRFDDPLFSHFASEEHHNAG
jgi:hypothetical protein